MKALVLGAAGQLGSELVRLLGPESGVSHEQASISDPDAIAEIVARRVPEVVFNCAAYNAVDRAETEEGAAYAANEHGPGIVAAACATHRARLVHFSTNFVFDGNQERPYTESDQPAPLSVYAMSKLMGERRVLEVRADFLVIRTAGVFGGPASFPSRILDRARSGQPLRVVADQTVNPTYAADLAAAAVELAASPLGGLVHGVAAGCTAWDEFARATLQEFGVDAKVDSITAAELGAPARRPRNGCLATTRFRPLRPWREALREWARRPRRA